MLGALLLCFPFPCGMSGYVPQRLSARPPLWLPLLLLLIISKLDGQAVSDAAEGGWLHFPVGHRVVEEADAVIVGPLDSEAHGAEVVDAHLGDVVGVQVDHLGAEGIWLELFIRAQYHRPPFLVCSSLGRCCRL